MGNIFHIFYSSMLSKVLIWLLIQKLSWTKLIKSSTDWCQTYLHSFFCNIMLNKYLEITSKFGISNIIKKEIPMKVYLERGIRGCPQMYK